MRTKKTLDSHNPFAYPILCVMKREEKNTVPNRQNVDIFNYTSTHLFAKFIIKNLILQMSYTYFEKRTENLVKHAFLV